MNTNGHPSREMLSAYADGSLSSGLSLLVAGHLTFCAQCRRDVEMIESVCGAVFATSASSKVGDICLDRALDAISGSPPEVGAMPKAYCDGVLPAPICQAAGGSTDEIRWGFRLPGLSEHVLNGYGDARVSMLRAKPGVRIPSHTHSGIEATLILQGTMQDGGKLFDRGQVALADHEDDHHPEIVGQETCICLVVQTGQLRFTGPMSRALNMFAGH